MPFIRKEGLKSLLFALKFSVVKIEVLKGYYPQRSIQRYEMPSIRKEGLKSLRPHWRPQKSTIRTEVLSP